jgi:hypothetical protein
MEEVKQDAKQETVETKPAEATSASEKESTTATAEVGKTEVGKEQTEVKTETAEEPWHKDPRFKKFLDEKKQIEERLEAFKGIEQDPDFAAFLAIKRQKEAIEAAGKEEKVDFSKMTADEYASYVENKAREAARVEYQNLVESNKKGDKVTQEAIGFAESVGVDKATFQKEYGPKIIEYYEKVGKRIGMEKLDAFVDAVPPKEVFKSFFFDKAGEIGVKKYKEEVDKAKKSTFDTGTKPKEETLPTDSKGKFEAMWAKAYGSATELPESAFGKQRG